MESPPSFSTQSDLPLLSEDSGLLVTSGSFSSDSVSGCQRADCITSELQESDYDEQSLSNDSSDFVDPMCGENFNTVRKGAVKVASTIQPPIQFQDYPTAEFVKNWVNTENETGKVDKLHINTKKTLMVPTAMKKLSPLFTRNVKEGSLYDCRPSFNRKFSSSRLLHVSPCRSSRPASRNSLTSRLSSSHNSLVTQLQVDDSSFITQAISHDTLIVDTTDICDIYNVPFDSDIYAMPVDMVRPMSKGKKKYRPLTKRKCDSYNVTCHFPQRCIMSKDNGNLKDSKLKRFSFHNVTAKSPINYIESNKDSLHVTLREMRNYIHTLYSTSSDSDSIYVQKGSKNAISCKKKAPREAIKDKDNGNKVYLKEHIKTCDEEANNNNKKHSINLLNVHSRKSKSTCDKTDVINKSDKYLEKGHKSKVSPMRILSMNLKQSLCNLFRWRRYSVSEQSEEASGGSDKLIVAPSRRALPPLPQAPLAEPPMADMSTDFATSIQKVKDYGWYWGPISVEAAEKILSNEPDGSFIVRDSSDDHYIFTLTFKLNGLRHVRIEHDQGNFCFGGCTMFKAQTIVDFIENAVETSRSGRYLFFLNLRPMLGPVRVQLLYPVSRFKRVQSLQHMCRFMILKCVRRDLVNSLPLPRRLLDYLCATHYYSELLADM